MKRHFFPLIALFSWVSLTAQVTPTAFAEPAAQALTVNPATETALPGIDLIWGFKIPMRDGIRLNGTVYKPTGQREPLPVIFTLTPYVADIYHERGIYFSQHGYVFVSIDVRGRGNSGGVFNPFVQEPHDGYDIVEYLARQPWCNGKVTMWGGSYAGFDQWMTLKEFPPHLATVVPVAAPHAGTDFPYMSGISYSYAVEWMSDTSGVTGNDNLFFDEKFWFQKFREMYFGQRPFNTLDQIAGVPSPIFQTWMQHPSYDSYWQALSPTPEQYAKINLPILSITGSYDGDQPGALAYYHEHMQYGNAADRAQHYLIIGPWDHPGTRTPQKEVGGLTFGGASLLDMNDLHRQWYDWTLKNGPKPEFLKKRVAYYVVGPGAENWKYADDLDSIASEHRKLYLSSQNSTANDVFHSGDLGEPSPASAPDKFVYDPSDLRPAEIEKYDMDDGSGITDESLALNLFGNGVVYHSAPFAEATEITGKVKLSVWMAMDVPDTDFIATIYEILPNGASVRLSRAFLRARYRESLKAPKLVTPGEITRYDFDDFRWFSRRVSRDSRLRLVVNCINSFNWEKNYNSGGDVEKESGKDARVAHITVYHDAEHPSVLEIPVVK